MEEGHIVESGDFETLAAQGEASRFGRMLALQAVPA
jgi:hypothetical protein